VRPTMLVLPACVWGGGACVAWVYVCGDSCELVAL